MLLVAQAWRTLWNTHPGNPVPRLKREDDKGKQLSDTFANGTDSGLEARSNQRLFPCLCQILLCWNYFPSIWFDVDMSSNISNVHMLLFITLQAKNTTQQNMVTRYNRWCAVKLDYDSFLMLSTVKWVGWRCQTVNNFQPYLWLTFRKRC